MIIKIKKNDKHFIRASDKVLTVNLRRIWIEVDLEIVISNFTLPLYTSDHATELKKSRLNST